MVAALAALAGILTYGDFPADQAAVFAAVLLVPAAVFAAFKYRAAKTSWKRSMQAKVGVESERKTRSAIRKEKPFLAAYGLRFNNRGGDLDLTLVTSGLRVAAVEIKTGFGEVRMYGNQIRAGRNLIKGDPLGQVDRQAEKLDRELGTLDVLRVVCIPGMTNRPFIEDGTLVTGPKGMIKTINRLANPVFNSDREAMAAIDRLAGKCGMKRRKL